MNMLLINKIKQTILEHFFDDVVVEKDHVVYVNLDWLTTRNYQFEGLNEFLYSVAQYRNHQFVFLIRDGVNARLTGMTEVIKKVIQDLALDSESCFIYGYDDLHIPQTTYLPMDAVSMWSGLVYNEIKDLAISHNQFTKKFSAMYGRYDMFRLKLYRHLVTYHSDSSLLSFNSGAVHFNHRFSQHFRDDYEWFSQHGGQVIDYESGYGSVPYQAAMSQIHQHYQSYFLEVVAETDVHSNRFFTEKTVKNFHLGKPFLLLNGQYSLRYLQRLGFRTFAPWINESYDALPAVHDRLAAILAEVDRLAQLSVEQLQQLHQEMQPVFEHNRQHFGQVALE